MKSRARFFLPLAGLGLFLAAGCAAPLLRPSMAPPTGLAAATAPAPPPDVTLLAGGDVLPGAWLNPYLSRFGQEYPYQAIAPLFWGVDLGLVNLECPLSLRGRPFRGKKFTFRACPAAAAALRNSGITVVSLANNHILDYGAEALRDTLAALEEAGVAFAGAGENLAASRRPAVLFIPPATRVAVLSYSKTYPAEFWATRERAGTAPGEDAFVAADVNSAAAWADLVIVCFHWGGELLERPRVYQENLAHTAIDAGARLVLGSHPHVLQGLEWYRHGLIAYSLGNLAFGGGRSRKATESALIKIRAHPDGQLAGAWIIPLSVDNLATEFVPRPVTGTAAAAVFQKLGELSQKWRTRIVPDVNGGAEIFPPQETSDGKN